mmetsp:Transcript_41100/g.87736  ORF Transcript_41100/g.87736 Transcript_41100/m.87736 type:complete len:340 (+) Transcript_41100:97-1116(+)
MRPHAAPPTPWATLHASPITLLCVACAGGHIAYCLHGCMRRRPRTASASAIVLSLHPLVAGSEFAALRAGACVTPCVHQGCAHCVAQGAVGWPGAQSQPRSRPRNRYRRWLYGLKKLRICCSRAGGMLCFATPCTVCMPTLSEFWSQSPTLMWPFLTSWSPELAFPFSSSSSKKMPFSFSCKISMTPSLPRTQNLVLAPTFTFGSPRNSNVSFICCCGLRVRSSVSITSSCSFGKMWAQRSSSLEYMAPFVSMDGGMSIISEHCMTGTDACMILRLSVLVGYCSLSSGRFSFVRFWFCSARQLTNRMLMRVLLPLGNSQNWKEVLDDELMRSKSLHFVM